MARRKYAGIFEVIEEEPREKGSVLFADPCTPTFTKAINKYIEPKSSNARVRETPRIESMTGNLVPWSDRTRYTAQDSWASMNAKRGVSDEDKR